jgi:hypothetical protein
MTKWFIIKLILISFFGLALEEVSVLIYSFHPSTEAIYPKHMYLSKSYEQPKVTVLYFFYELSIFLNKFIQSIVVFKLASVIDNKLRQVFFWIMLMYAVKIYYYLYDRDTVFKANIILYGIILLICSVIVWPDKEFTKLKAVK